MQSKKATIFLGDDHESSLWSHVSYLFSGACESSSTNRELSFTGCADHQRVLLVTFYFLRVRRHYYAENKYGVSVCLAEERSFPYLRLKTFLEINLSGDEPFLFSAVADSVLIVRFISPFSSLLWSYWSSVAGEFKDFVRHGRLRSCFCALVGGADMELVCGGDVLHLF